MQRQRLYDYVPPEQRLMGYGEVLGSLMSSAAAEPLAGWAGLATGNPAAIDATRKMLTYEPRTQQGQQNMQAVGEAMEPVASGLQWLEQKAGDLGYKIGGPTGGAIGATIPTALGTMVPGGYAAKKLAGTNYPEVPSNFRQSGMIAGRSANNADLDALKQAELMKADGVDADTIYAQTKWWLDHPDGQPRFEIDDSKMRVKPVDEWGWGSSEDFKQYNSTSGGVDEFMDHPAVSENYDGLVGFGDADHRLMMSVRRGEPGNASIGDNNISLYATDRGIDKKAAGHELQHAIQTRQGFSIGGDPAEFSIREYMDKMKPLQSEYWTMNSPTANRLRKAQGNFKEIMKIRKNNPEEYLAINDIIGKYRQSSIDDTLNQMGIAESKILSPDEQYHNLGGESEARLVENRLDMSMDERLANPFYKNYDVPFDDMILRSDSNGLNMSVSGGILDPEDVARRAANRLKREQAKQLRDEQKVIEATAKAEREKLLNNAVTQDVDDYKMAHTAPGREQGYSADDLSGVYPEDIYSPKGLQYYGSGKEYRSMDADTLSTLNSLRGMPDAEVDIFRAAPKGTQINPNDWVTLSREYAQKHGDAYLDDYDILTQKAKASDLFTSGDSLQEWGWSPLMGNNKGLMR